MSNIENTANSRRVGLEVSLNGHSLTDNVHSSLLSFSYIDNLSGKADEIELSIQDSKKNWQDNLPYKGMEILATIKAYDWLLQSDAELFCGTFKIDELSFNGPPDVFKIKALTSNLTSKLRDTTKTRAFENQSFESIARQIAHEHSLELYYDAPNYSYLRIDQREEADLPFITRLAKDNAMHCKVHNNKLILLDAKKLDSQQAALSISKYSSNLFSYDFSLASSQTDFTSAKVEYNDPTDGQVHYAHAETKSEHSKENEKTLQINQRVESSAQAQSLAENALYNANTKGQKANLKVMGSPQLIAGMNIRLEDFASFSGEYSIEKATHSIGSSGYTTKLELKKIAQAQLQKSVLSESSTLATAYSMPVGTTSLPEFQNPINPDLSENFSFVQEEILGKLLDFDEDFQKLARLLLCLPEIANAMQEKANEIDKQGWHYLENMFYKWFAFPANDNANNNTEAYWVDIDYVLSFERAKERFDYFTDSFLSHDGRRNNIINAPAKEQLAKILERNGYFEGRNRTFNFINDNWQDWEDKYHTHIAVEEPSLDSIPTVDGLFVALENFTFRALTKGRVEYISGNSYTIIVENIAIFVHDKFNFEVSYDEATGIETSILGAWSCENLDLDFININPLDSYSNIANSSFELFRNTLGHGSDFLVLSMPKTLANFKEVSYEFEL